MLKFLEGKKTYIVAALIALGAGWQALGHTIPEWVYMILTAGGLTAVRDALNRMKQ